MYTVPGTMLPGRGRGNVDAGSASVTGSPQSTLTLYHGLPVSSLRATSAASTLPVRVASEVSSFCVTSPRKSGPSQRLSTARKSASAAPRTRSFAQLSTEGYTVTSAANAPQEVAQAPPRPGHHPHDELRVQLRTGDVGKHPLNDGTVEIDDAHAHEPRRELPHVRRHRF